MNARFQAGVWMAVGGTTLFAMKSIVIKFAYRAGSNALELLTLRMLFSLPFYLVVMAYFWKKEPARRPSARLTALIVGIGFLGYYASSFLDLKGLEHISAQVERMTLFAYPAFVTALAWMFLGERITRPVALALALTYAGIVLLAVTERADSSPDGRPWLGVGLVLGSALSYAVYVLFAKKLMARVGSGLFTSLAMIGSTGFIAAHFLLSGGDWRRLFASWPVLGWAFTLAFFCTVIPSFLINEAIDRIGPSRATILGAAGPAVTAFLAVSLLGETFSVWHAAGMALIFIGVALIGRSGKKA